MKKKISVMYGGILLLLILVVSISGCISESNEVINCTAYPRTCDYRYSGWSVEPDEEAYCISHNMTLTLVNCGHFDPCFGCYRENELGMRVYCIIEGRDKMRYCRSVSL